MPRGVSVTHGRNLNVITTSLRRHDVVTCVADFARSCNSLDVADRADLLRPPSDSMPLFVPRLKMDCGGIVRETVYMTDEDAGEYWRLSPDRYSALCLLHSLRQVPVVWRSALVAECGMTDGNFEELISHVSTQWDYYEESVPKCFDLRLGGDVKLVMPVTDLVGCDANLSPMDLYSRHTRPEARRQAGTG